MKNETKRKFIRFVEKLIGYKYPPMMVYNTEKHQIKTIRIQLSLPKYIREEQIKQEILCKFIQHIGKANQIQIEKKSINKQENLITASFYVVDINAVGNIEA